MVTKAIHPTEGIVFLLCIGAGTGQPVNGAIPSLPSPTMPTFNMAAQTPNGQPGGTEAVYTNGIPQTYPAREYFFSNQTKMLLVAEHCFQYTTI